MVLEGGLMRESSQAIKVMVSCNEVWYDNYLRWEVSLPQVTNMENHSIKARERAIQAIYLSYPSYLIPLATPATLATQATPTTQATPAIRLLNLYFSFTLPGTSLYICIFLPSSCIPALDQIEQQYRGLKSRQAAKQVTK